MHASSTEIVTFGLAEHGTSFATRQRGSELRAAAVRAAGGAKRMQLDFAGVLSVSFSFADELAAELVDARRRGLIMFEPAIVNANADVERVIARSIARRDH